MDRPAGWRYLELTYDPLDRARVLLDGVPVADEAPVGDVVSRLGVEGWEMVGSASGGDTQQTLWFRRPIDPPAPDAATVPDAARSASAARRSPTRPIGLRRVRA